MTGRLKGGRDESWREWVIDWNSSSPGRGIVKVERGREMSFAEKKSQWLVEEREVVWNSGDRSRDK